MQKTGEFIDACVVRYTNVVFLKFYLFLSLIILFHNSNAPFPNTIHPNIYNELTFCHIFHQL